MSGGSHDYAYRHVEQFADEIDWRPNLDAPDGPGIIRQAFADHLRQVAKAMHAIEWVDSSDWAPEHEIEPIALAMGRAPDLNADLLRRYQTDAAFHYAIDLVANLLSNGGSL